MYTWFSTHDVKLKKYMQHSLFANKKQNVNLNHAIFCRHRALVGWLVFYFGFWRPFMAFWPGWMTSNSGFVRSEEFLPYGHNKFQKGAILTERLVIVRETNDNSVQIWMCSSKPGQINGVKLLWRMKYNPESESSKTCRNNKFLFGMETLTFHIFLEGRRSGFGMVSIMPRP